MTDLYLLALAKAHQGMLATFDAGLKHIASGSLGGLVEYIPPGQH